MDNHFKCQILCLMHFWNVETSCSILDPDPRSPVKLGTLSGRTYFASFPFLIGGELCDGMVLLQKSNPVFLTTSCFGSIHRRLTAWSASQSRYVLSLLNSAAKSSFRKFEDDPCSLNRCHALEIAIMSSRQFLIFFFPISFMVRLEYKRREELLDKYLELWQRFTILINMLNKLVFVQTGAQSDLFLQTPLMYDQDSFRSCATRQEVLCMVPALETSLIKCIWHKVEEFTCFCSAP